jgi:hypothetical protein
MLPDLPLVYLVKHWPEKGIDTWSLGYSWADPARVAHPKNIHDDVILLEKYGISMIRKLLNANPTWFCRVTDIPWSSIAAYCTPRCPADESLARHLWPTWKGVRPLRGVALRPFSMILTARNINSRMFAKKIQETSSFA